MLTIRRIEIENFVCFDRLVIVPSADAAKPLTVIRAENGCGKTTLLRAIRWGMYGDMSLPANSNQYSLHPADWHPDDAGVITTVRIEFETDGSCRDHPGDAGSSTLYELTRAVTTIGQPQPVPDGPDFRRFDMRTQLMVRSSDGSWDRHDAGVDQVIQQLLPWELRDFFVMDADEVADFVGGSENKTISRKAVTEKTTYAIRALLGLDVFKRASEQVSNLSREFGRRATKAIGSADLDRQQEELDELRSQQERLQRAVKEGEDKEREVDDRLDESKNTLEALVGDIAVTEQLHHRMSHNRTRSQELIMRRKNAVKQYAGELHAIDLLGALARRELAQAQHILQPLYDSDMIPLKHLGFVRSLLRSGVCVCGQDLSHNGIHRQHVEEVIAQSSEQEERAEFLAQVLDAATALRVDSDESAWSSRCGAHADEISEIDDETATVDLDRRDIESKLSAIPDEHVQVTRDRIETLETQRDTIKRELRASRIDLDERSRNIVELDRRIAQQRKRQRAARDQEACKDTADAIVSVLELAYATIEAEQVQELSDEMGALFSKMVANVEDDESQALDRKATLKMIAEVGVRQAVSSPGEFEVYALNHRGRSMPPTEINGASRRTLALSFVLALCSVSNTRASLIADSLLNFMSGVVRTNTLEVTAANSTQPILLLTGSDLEAPSEVETIKRFAGATYTLTGQWQHGTRRGDVINQTDARRVTLLCDCGARQYCRICERVGQGALPGWTARDSVRAGE